MRLWRNLFPRPVFSIPRCLLTALHSSQNGTAHSAKRYRGKKKTAPRYRCNEAAVRKILLAEPFDGKWQSLVAA